MRAAGVTAETGSQQHRDTPKLDGGHPELGEEGSELTLPRGHVTNRETLCGLHRIATVCMQRTFQKALSSPEGRRRQRLRHPLLETVPNREEGETQWQSAGKITPSRVPFLCQDLETKVFIEFTHSYFFGGKISFSLLN